LEKTKTIFYHAYGTNLDKLSIKQHELNYFNYQDVNYLSKLQKLSERKKDFYILYLTKRADLLRFLIFSRLIYNGPCLQACTGFPRLVSQSPVNNVY